MDNYNNTNNNDNQGYQQNPYQQNPYQQNPYQQNQQNPYQQNVSPQGTPYPGQNYGGTNYGGQQAPPPYQGANYGQQPQDYPQGPVVINQLEHKKDNLAVCSLVFGIMGAVFCWLLVIPIVCTIAGLSRPCRRNRFRNQPGTQRYIHAAVYSCIIIQIF